LATDSGIESSPLGPISVKTPIDAPRERVYELLCDLAARPAFTDHFVSDYRLQRLESSGVGATARFRLLAPGLWVETVITDVAPPHRIHERGAGGRWDRIPITTSWELLESGSGGCEVTLRFMTAPSHPLDRLREKRRGERYYRRQWSIALSRLKQLIESGRPPARVVVAGGARAPA
jgi:uncharacterized protein YndB with AHSA1/START domain